MTIEYTNRTGRTHYLHEGKTKTGKPKYFFSMKSEGTLVDFIPEGYEIYEHPSAQVFLRRIPPQIVTPEEVEIVRQGIKKYTKIEYFILDVKDKNIIIYLCDQNYDDLVQLASFAPDRSIDQIKSIVIRSLSYTPMMQFVLENKQTRTFSVKRWCFRGRVDDWIPLGAPNNLIELVKKYIGHLGQESFYDLM